MAIFDPSIFIALFPYLFIGSFPVIGIVIVILYLLKFKEKSDRKSDSM